MSLIWCVVMLCLSNSISEGAENTEKEDVKLRNEEDVEKLREEALAKLEIPLEKMKIKAS